MPKPWIFLAIALVAFGFVAFAVFTRGNKVSQVAEAAPYGSGDAIRAALTLTTDEVVLGSHDAPVTVVAYMSFTCSHCGAFHRDTLPALKTRYIDDGRVKLVFRDFPLDQAALAASALVRCAPPSRRIAFGDALFAQQATWATAADLIVALSTLGEMGGVGAEAYRACLDDKALVDAIVESRLQAEKSLEVASTPTFFVDDAGVRIDGAQPLAVFVTALDAVLAKAEK